MKCPSCGIKIEKEKATFCPYCGCNLNSKNIPDESQKGLRNRKYKIMGIVIIAVVAAIVILVSLVFSNNKPGKKEIEQDLTDGLSYTYSDIQDFSYSIIQTSLSNDYCMIQVNLDAIGTYAEFEISGSISYYKSGRKWVNTDCSLYKTSYKITKYPDEETLYDDLERDEDCSVAGTSESGDVFIVQLSQRIDEGWYTYQRNYYDTFVFEPEYETWEYDSSVSYVTATDSEITEDIFGNYDVTDSNGDYVGIMMVSDLASADSFKVSGEMLEADIVFTFYDDNGDGSFLYIKEDEEYYKTFEPADAEDDALYIIKRMKGYVEGESLQDTSGSVKYYLGEVVEPSVIANGNVSENVAWELNNRGVLTISGEGEIPDYDYSKDTPWYSKKNSIKSIVIEEGITAIGKYAFSHFFYITNVSIPDTVTSIGEEAFCECGITSIIIPDSVTTIGKFAFYSCSDLTSFTAGSGLTILGDYSFEMCTSLTSVTLGDNLKTIGNCAFNLCGFLSDIVIPDSVESIGESAFWNLKNITLGSGVLDIADNAFSSCGGLEKVYYNATLDKWLQITFDNAGANPCYNGANLYVMDGSEYSLLRDAVISDGTTAISSYTFYNCNSISSITIPSSVSTIGGSAFKGCSNLANIYFEGDAPEMADDVLQNVTATVSYPSGNSTWTNEMKQQYGGTIVWEAY